MNEEIKKFICSRYGSSNKDRFPGPQPISLERVHLPILQKNDYLVCEKTDGVRHFLVCFTDSQNRKICALVNRKLDFVLYSITIPRDTLLDGELIGDVFVAHDAVCIQGEDLTRKNLIERLEKIRAVCKIAVCSKLRVQCKHMIQYRDVSTLSLGPGTDGVIFTPVHERVLMGTHRTLFKWKPLEKITIDFVVHKGNLCIQHESVMLPIQTAPNDFAEGAILECILPRSTWIVLKERTDKNYPNNKRTFDRTLVNIRENIKFCELGCF